ncbi:hemicentin-1-like isoform X4 [Orbicella faveolata]|uniref:hemicentin-1-like isoform X4 n=1 Tax=Orbicella faveolata TaxID=48498 RepID=UPI0009E22367|nr:hemicentin-1-like isoform X4 [Orbicella faveolata]
MEGYDLTVLCNASGIPPPMLTWIKVGGGDVSTNGSELVFTNSSRTQAGEYRCEASNECGNASETVTVEVQFKPDNVQLETSAADNKACRGDVISVNCSADAVPSEISYRLLENDIAIFDTSGMWTRNFTTEGTFIYKCMANNTLGTGDNASVTVTVNVPSFIQPIQNKTIDEGENVTVSCNASGTPPPMVSWIKVDSGERFDASELVFTHINRSQAGEYRCEASNECGNASETATIEVQYPSENVQLKTSAADNKACEGETIGINCSADAVPSVTSYQLLENGSVVSDTSGMWSRTLSSGGVFIYKCVANNSLESTESESVTVTVNGKYKINCYLVGYQVVYSLDTWSVYCKMR